MAWPSPSLTIGIFASFGRSFVVRGRHDPRPPLVNGIDDRAVRAAFAVARRAIFPAVVQREVRRDRDEAEAVGDHLVEQRPDALVLLAVVRADRSEVELDVLDRHLRDVRDEHPSEGVRVRGLRLLQEETHRVIRLR